MYLPDIFRETNADEIAELIESHPLASLITLQDGEIVGDHVPFLFDAASKTLRAHVARANPLWRAFDPSTEALAIFSGLDHYVTPSWYPTKRETGKVVPTWNYEVVHIHGRLRAVDEDEWKRALLRDLTSRHESARPQAWALEDAPADFIEAQLKAIVGIELCVSRIEAKRKLSQNRNAADHAGVVAGLRSEGRADSDEMANIMSGPARLEKGE